MSAPHAVPGSLSSGGRASDEAQSIEALVQALHGERCQLDDLFRALERQRAAISANDIDGIEASVREVQSILLTLGEALTRRRHLTELITGEEGVELDHLSAELAGKHPRVEVAIRELVAVARVVDAELDSTRALLRSAIATGDHYLRTMSGEDDREALYRRPADAEARGRSVLFDRQA